MFLTDWQSNSPLIIQSGRRSNAIAHTCGQISSNFQASWRFNEIRKPPTFLSTTSNFSTYMTIETLHLFKSVVGGDYLRKEKPQKGRQDRELRHGRQNGRDRPDRHAEYIWHLTLTFQDTCAGQLLQLLRCLSNFNISDILKVMSVDGRRHCNCGWQRQPFDIIMYHFSLNILQSMRVRVW